METCIIHPIQLYKRVCLSFQSVKPSFRGCVREAQKHFVLVVFKSPHNWFSLPDRSYIRRLIFRYFICKRKYTHYSRFVDWGGRGAHWLMILFWLSRSILGSSWRFKSRGPDFTNRFINPFITFTFHRGLKIRIIRPRNRTAFNQTTIRHIYFA